ncbi:MAG: SprB repeat-containing protein, partial [Bacteroidetes bacterium]|nr:SprB repeat-containing protein [Bacteroidota bacterium]
LRVDVTGNIYVTGVTDASDFPTQSWGSAYFSGYKGASDAFILRFSNTGMRQWATYYGGNQLEDGGQGPTSGDNLEIDNCGNIYISFDTYSSNIPTLNPGCASYFDGSFGGGTGSDQFLVEFNNTGTLLWATYIGGSNNDFRSPLAIDKNNNVFFGGEWTNYASGAGLPTMNPAGGAYFDNTPNGNDDSFIMKFVPVSPTYTKVQVNQSGCSCNGTATVTVNCGTAPYNYVWNNGSQTLNTVAATNTITGLCAGNYNVIVTDAACIQVPDTVYFTISGSGGLTLTPNQINAGCVNPGSATVTASGGTGPYTYSWSPAGQTSQTATGLSAGNYTVTVTDNTGCISNKLYTIVKDTGNVSIGISPTDAGCSAGSKTGNATVNIISGTSPYIYSWSNGQTTQTATGLNASVYTVTVTDNTGCTSIRTTNNTNGHRVKCKCIHSNRN